MPTPPRSFALLLVLAVGCATPDAVQPVAIPFAPEVEPEPEVDPLHALGALAAAPANKAIASDLASLVAVETDARCRTFLDAGTRAWVAGCRDAARALWAMALDCRPMRSVCLPVGQTHALLLHRPLDFGALPALGELGPLAAPRPAHDVRKVDLGAPARRDLARLVEAVVPPAGPDGCVVVRGEHALELVPRATLEARGQALAAFAQRQRGVAIAVEVRWLRFPLAPKGTAALFGAPDGRELDRLELERLRGELGGVIVCAPRLTVFPGQTGHIALVRTFAYIADFEFSAHPSGTFVADPVIATAVAGQTVDVCAAVTAPDAIALLVAPASCEVGEPLPDQRLVVPGLGSGFVVQTPRAARYSLSRVVTIPTGRTRWIPIGMTCDAEGVRYGIGLAIEASTQPLGESGAAPTKAAPVVPGK